MNKEFLRCYFIAGPQNFPGLSIWEAQEKIVLIMKSGVTAYQFRDKGTVYQNDRQRLELAQNLRDTARKLGIPFIVNDDVGLAIALKADGVHLGQNDEKLSDARQKVGRSMIIGLSVNNATELAKAQESQADYLGVGPVYPTLTKTDATHPIGVQELGKMMPQNHLPIVGIGGIGLSVLPELVHIGIDGIAVISLLTGSNHPDTVAKTVLDTFKAH